MRLASLSHDRPRRDLVCAYTLLSFLLLSSTLLGLSYACQLLTQGVTHNRSCKSQRETEVRFARIVMWHFDARSIVPRHSPATSSPLSHMSLYDEDFPLAYFKCDPVSNGA